MKVLIAVPTHKSKLYCLDVFMEGLSELVAYTRSQDIECEVCFTVHSEDAEYIDALNAHFLFTPSMTLLPAPRKSLEVPDDHVFDSLKKEETYMSNICHARNILREWCLIRGCDYIFMLDSDGIVEKDCIVKLLHLSCHMASPTFAHRLFTPDGTVLRPIVSIRDKDSIAHSPDENGNWPSKVLYEFDAGFGSVLISSELMRKIGIFTFSVDHEGYIAFSEDCWFFNRINKVGILNAIDTSIRTIHFCDPQIFPNGYCNDQTLQRNFRSEDREELSMSIQP